MPSAAPIGLGDGLGHGGILAARRVGFGAPFDDQRISVHDRADYFARGFDGRVLARFVLKYTLSAGHPQLGGVDLDLAVEDDVFHSIRLTRMDDEFGSNGKSSVAAICEISQACRLTMKARISVPGSGAGGKRWHPKQARFCPEETHVCSGHFGLTCAISDSDVINGVCHFQRRTLTVDFCTNLASTLSSSPAWLARSAAATAPSPSEAVQTARIACTRSM